MSGDKQKQVGHSRRDFAARKEIYAHARVTGATQKAAAIAAGYKPSNAHFKGWQLDKDPEVVAIMEAQKVALRDKYIQDQHEMLSCLGKIAAFNIKDLYDENGNLKPIHELPEHVAYAISAVDVDVTSTAITKKIKILDKIKAIAEAAKILGITNNPPPPPPPANFNFNYIDYSRKIAFTLELAQRGIIEQK